MSTLHDSVMGTSGLPLLKYSHGQTVTYTPSGGAAVSLTALVGREEVRASTADDTGRQRQTLRAMVIDIADGVSPARYDNVDIDGDTWRVEWVESLSGGRARIKLCLVARHG